MKQGQDQGLSASLVAARDRLLGKIDQGELLPGEASTDGSSQARVETHLDPQVVAPSSSGSVRRSTTATSIPGVARNSAQRRADPRGLRPISQTSGPPIFAERYRVLGKIGEGGAAKVFRAEHTGTGRTVALKLLLNSSLENANVRARFVEEARVTTKIAHPHIVEMLDAGISSEGLPFVVMELLDGETLAALLKREEKLDWPRARMIVLQLAAALAHAHDQGVVHRDVKPDNVIIEGLRTGRLHCKIIDFGLAQLAEQHAQTWVSHVGQPIGTAPTMSPEQVRGQVVTPASDIYALGCVLYRILSGQYPFAAASLVEFATAHLFATPNPLPPLDLDPDLHEGLQAVISRCLAKEPEDRFLSMADLGQAIHSLDSTATTLPPLSLDGTPAEPPSPFSFDSDLPLAHAHISHSVETLEPLPSSHGRWGLRGVGAVAILGAAAASLLWLDTNETPGEGVVQAGASLHHRSAQSNLLDEATNTAPKPSQTGTAADRGDRPDRPAHDPVPPPLAPPESGESARSPMVNQASRPPVEQTQHRSTRKRPTSQARRPASKKSKSRRGLAGPPAKHGNQTPNSDAARGFAPSKTSNTSKAPPVQSRRRRMPDKDSKPSKSSVLIDPTAKISRPRKEQRRRDKKRLINPFEQ